MDDVKNKRGYLNKDFKIFHIKDKKELDFEFHYHDFNKIVIFISGKVTYLIEGKNYKLKPWDILLINSSDIHKAIIDPNETYERIIIWVNSDFLLRHNMDQCNLLNCFEIVFKEKYNLLRLNTYLLNEIKNVLYQLEASVEDDKFGSKILSNSLFLQFVIYLNRCFLDRKHIEEFKDIEYDKTIGDVINYINENLPQDLSLDKISSVFYMSKYYLMRKFKIQTGYTIHKYILNKRLMMASSLIKQGDTANEASLKSGFRDYSTFVRAFKKVFGETPSKFNS